MLRRTLWFMIPIVYIMTIFSIALVNERNFNSHKYTVSTLKESPKVLSMRVRER